jgi:chromosome segregation ATPase
VNILTIQSVGNYSQVQSPLKTDFQNFRQGFGNLVEALKSGNQDQITLSGNALQQAMAQFQTDLTKVPQGDTSSQKQNTTPVDFRNLLGAVNSAREAIKSGIQDQITASQNALQQATTQFQTDLNTIQQTNTSSQSQNSTQTDFQSLLGAINSVLDAQKSGNQDQITAANDAMQKAITQLQTDLPSLQQAQGHHHHHHNHQQNSTNSPSANNNLLSYLAAVTGYGSNGQSQTTTNINSLNLKA